MLILLWLCVAIQALSGLAGGLALTLRPSGTWLHLPLDFLNGTPFSSYFIPGLTLLVVLGIYPALVLYGLVSLSRGRLLESCNLYKQQRWAWGGSVQVGLLLILWIDFEVMFIGYRIWVQIAYALLGVAIVWLTLLPVVSRYYRLS